MAAWTVCRNAQHLSIRHQMLTKLYIQQSNAHEINVGNFPLVHYDSMMCTWIRSCVAIARKNWKRQFGQQQQKWANKKKAQTKTNERASEQASERKTMKRKKMADRLCRVCVRIFPRLDFYCGAYCRRPLTHMHVCECETGFEKCSMFIQCVNMRNERKIRRVAMIHIFRFVFIFFFFYLLNCYYHRRWIVRLGSTGHAANTLSHTFIVNCNRRGRTVTLGTRRVQFEPTTTTPPTKNVMHTRHHHARSDGRRGMGDRAKGKSSIN